MTIVQVPPSFNPEEVPTLLLAHQQKQLLAKQRPSSQQLVPPLQGHVTSDHLAGQHKNLFQEALMMNEGGGARGTSMFSTRPPPLMAKNHTPFLQIAPTPLTQNMAGSTGFWGPPPSVPPSVPLTQRRPFQDLQPSRPPSAPWKSYPLQPEGPNPLVENNNQAGRSKIFPSRSHPGKPRPLKTNQEENLEDQRLDNFDDQRPISRTTDELFGENQENLLPTGLMASQ